jgi:hypothetical protein
VTEAEEQRGRKEEKRKKKSACYLSLDLACLSILSIDFLPTTIFSYSDLLLPSHSDPATFKIVGGFQAAGAPQFLLRSR